MKTLLQISLLFFLLTQMHYPQWVQVGPSGLTIYSLATSGSNVFAGTYLDGLYRSIDDGQTWTQTSLNTGTISAIAISGEYIIAGGNYLYISSDNGQSWVQSSLNFSDVNSLTVNGSDIFAGTGTGVYISYDGQNWTQTLNNQSVHSLSVTGSNIFAGTWSGGVFRSSDYGQTWSQTSLNSVGVKSITVNGSNVIAGTWEEGLYLSSNSGETWSHTWALYDVSALLNSTSNVFAGSNGVYYSFTNGITWTNVSQGLPTGYTVLTLAVSEEYFYAGLVMGFSVWRRPLNQIVPVELTSFTASVVNSEIILNWTTASELNNQGFEIERSFNSQSFSKIGFVPGSGSTTETKSYSFTITDAPAGIQYYRLKQIDFDGSSEYSDIVEVENNIPDKFMLSQNFPNPFNPSTTISFSLPVEANVNIKLFNMLGQELAEITSGNFQAGNHNLEFNANNLSSGTYFYLLEATGNNGEHFNSTKKMILMK